jgi:tetratricopeptide (TPR) repeat protein
MENRLYPMRELLGDMLRGYGEPAAALKEYEVSMKNAPSRLRGYYGAAKAAQDSGQAKKVGAYYKQLARLTRDTDIENYLGYAYRNLGEMPLAFKHYSRALQLNPRHRGAHEYLGEAYLMIKNLAKAKEHLAALQSICLLPCAEYGDLEKKVAEYRKASALRP